MRKNYNGFTLIELLFVIAIIGVLASLGVSMAEKKAEEFKIKKAALQVQYVLEAGLSYYADNKKWPLDGYSQRYDTKGFPYANNCTDATDTDFRNFCDNYIGSGYKNIGPALRNDPWGQQPYSWWTLSTGGSYTTGRFTVQVKTPNVKIAQRLAALLPSGAYCKPNGTMNWDCVPNADPGHLWVRAYANIPGQVHNDNFNVVDAGVVDERICKLNNSCNNLNGNDKHDCIFTCTVPKTINCQGMTPHVFSSLDRSYILLLANNSPGIRMYSEAKLNKSNQPEIKIHIGFDSDNLPVGQKKQRGFYVYKEVGAFYLVTCENS